MLLHPKDTCTHTCCNVVGGNNAGINTRVACTETMPGGDLTRGAVAAHTLLCVLTVCVAPLTVADVDVVDVRVGFQCEDEADQVGSGQQHGDCVHQGTGERSFDFIMS